MDSDDDCNFEELYELGDDSKHSTLVDNVLKLNKSQQLRKPSRSEPTLQISEFDLVKSITGPKGSIEISDLAQVLKNRKSRLQIGQKLKKTTRHSHTLPKPLEKPQGDRIRRAVAYEKVRLELDKWEPTIEANRVSTDLRFPLDNDFKLEQKKAAEDFTNTWTAKTDLDIALEKKLPPVEEFHVDMELEDKSQFPLTLKEMLSKRREAAKLRAFQGYKEANARRQSKIKSKKYHRIQKRERIKQKLKEFEQLQKTNPEEALKKLEEIDKARVEERFSLRHKSTGQWARSKQVRAKYDKKTRQVLAQQLTISRELTQKLKTHRSSDSEDDEAIPQDDIPPGVSLEDNNPWIGIKQDKEVTDFVNSYRKFWSEKSKQPDEEKQAEKVIEIPQKVAQVSCDQPHVQETVPKMKTKKKKKTKKSQLKNSASTSEWDVSTIEAANKTSSEIEIMFNKVENRQQKKMLKRASNLQKKMSKKVSTDKKNNTPKKEKYKPDLSLPIQTKKPIIDEALLETTHNAGEAETPTSQVEKNLQTILAADPPENPEIKNIDPHNYTTVKTTNLSTAIPDILTQEEPGEDAEDQRHIITEAFEDDDIADEFSREKSDEVDKDKPKNINLSLPGWGSWGGAGVKPSKRKRRRFTVKVPPKMPRRDDNKGALIINENAKAKLKEHLVSELPFPFKTVKDFEASIRAPIGNTFVPERAFRKYIQPAVITKMGTIIEPIARDILVNKH